MPKKVIITVDAHATTTTDYINFEGAHCISERQRFHELLQQFGVQIQTTDVTPKPELLTALESQQATNAHEETNHEVGMGQ